MCTSLYDQGPAVYVNYGRKQDFDELVAAGVNLTGTIAVARYVFALFLAATTSHCVRTYSAEKLRRRLPWPQN